MQTNVLKREFVIEKNNQKIKLADPNPSMSPESVMSLYLNQYPELATASVGTPEYKGDVAVYTFRTVVGTKG